MILRIRTTDVLPHLLEWNTDNNATLIVGTMFLVVRLGEDRGGRQRPIDRYHIRKHYEVAIQRVGQCSLIH